MGRLLIVSNRLPVQPGKSESGELTFTQSVGGLATGLNSFYRQRDAIWIGAASHEGHDQQLLTERLLGEHGCLPLFLDEEETDLYYTGFSNKTLWPIFHQFPQYATFDDKHWEAYKHVNTMFADVIEKVAKPKDTIWVHDYHLLLLPELLRERLPGCSLGFFLHIPFPSFEVFRMLPWRTELIEGMLGADVIGFHTFDYVRHFLSCCARLTGRPHSFGRIEIENREVRVDAFPMGIDDEHYAQAAHSEEVITAAREVREEFGEHKIMLSLDRLDYTKGICERVHAYDRFLEENPEWQGKVTLVIVAVPSRIDVEYYQQLKRELDELIGRVNGKHGSFDWTPVRYMYRSLEFTELVAFYRVADVMLVTPLRDGMNLVAKEYVAVKSNDGAGVLVLSELAGAAKELGEALTVNPYDQTEFVEALRKAVEIPEDEQKRRLQGMRHRLRRYNITRWANEFVSAVHEAREEQTRIDARRMSSQDISHAVSGYRLAESRLLMLDYDGTLVRLTPRFEEAGPDPELIEMLHDLAGDEQNELVIVSGRSRKMLESWFKGVPISLVAEHGAFMRRSGREWSSMVGHTDEWQACVHPVMEQYADRTPGARTEEKESALVWHYRAADPELGAGRARELRHVLEPLVSNAGLCFLEGSGVLEVRTAGADKGRAAETFLDERDWGFVFAAGDDRTDEEMFAVLPDSAYSINVGLHASRARFRVGSVHELRAILGRFGR